MKIIVKLQKKILGNKKTDFSNWGEPSKTEPGVWRCRVNDPSQVTGVGDIELSSHRLKPFLISLFLQQTNRGWVSLEGRVSECVNLLKKGLRFKTEYESMTQPRIILSS